MCKYAASIDADVSTARLHTIEVTVCVARIVEDV